ncbi:MAG: hypothetical protein ACOC1F_04395 [Myxococcota bacterium]
MGRRSRLALWVPLPLVVALSCSADEGGLGRPEVKTGPVAALTFAFENGGDEDIYVDWPKPLPRFVIRRDGTELMTERDCVPFCTDGCACSACAKPQARVRRIAVGETLQVSWEPLHFAVNSCNGSASCTCVESWPVTAGRYELSLAGFTGAAGGQTDPDDPAVLVGAEPTSESRSCSAVGVFDLAGGAVVHAKFSCL